MMAADKWKISSGVRCQANYAVTVRTITPYKDMGIYTLSLLMVVNTLCSVRLVYVKVTSCRMCIYNYLYNIIHLEVFHGQIQ